ncbi:unnamed protein product [Schistocephalus solidus]|uniref:Cystatin domain-containing protein n=1 Tax=Schistocephalus solidus TaxID=70667 RepID=A0A183TE81_SCHSO|nr:unnamed protein product [Schistocephalus solidus]
MMRSDVVQNKFYGYLYALLSTEPNADKLAVLGDLKVQVRTDHAVCEEVSLGGCNDNDLLLPHTCAEQRL